MRKRSIKKAVSLLMLFFTIFAFQLSPALAAQSDAGIELTLTVGESNLDVSNFVYDVTTAVYQIYGITGDRIRITKAGAAIVDSRNDFNWTIYDHYYSPEYPVDGSEPVDWEVYHSQNQPYYYYDEIDPWDNEQYFTDVSFDDDSLSYCNRRSKHIYPKDDGIVFVGYSVPAYKDFMVYPDQTLGEKTIEFAIDESGVSTHTLEGAGFLFNTSISDNIINGYLVFYNYLDYTIDLYKLTNVDAAAFHNERNYDISAMQIPGIELIMSKEWSSEESIKNIKVQVTNSSLKFFEGDVTIYDTTGPDSEIVIEDTGAGGFGPLVSYRSHWCSELSYFTFKDLTMETYRPLSFLDVINQQVWNDNTKRFIVNIDDDGVPEFSDAESLTQILSHMNNFGVNYIGWGLNDPVEGVESAVYNKEQAEQFIAQNGGRGMFINASDPNLAAYREGIAAIARYINSCLALPPDTGNGGSSGSSGGSSSSTPPPPPPLPLITFEDIRDHWSQKDVEKVATNKLVKGYPDGSFRPENPVTRAEFASMLAAIYSFAKLTPTTTEAVYFSDVSTSDWYYGPVMMLAPDEIIKGYGDGTFRPNKKITREEAAAMIVQMLSKLKIQMQDNEPIFTDNEQISFWAKNPLGKIQPLGIILGMPNGAFQPANNATRSEAVVMLLRMLEQAKLL